MWKETRVCYVEMCGAFPDSGMRDRTDDIRKAVERYEGFEFVSLRIEDAFDPAWWVKVGGKDELQELGVDLGDEELPLSSLQPSDDFFSPLSALQRHLSSLPTTTAIQSTLSTLTRLLLLYTALSTSSSHLLLGTTLTGLSIRLISGVAMGGGFVVREEAGEEWVPRIKSVEEKSKIVKIVRPLRDIGMKECAAWVWWNNLSVVGKEKEKEKQGIGGLTKDFIVGLERDYPSTVSTIARTCAKLAPKEATTERCIMCERPAQRGVQDWKARISIRSFASLDSDVLTIPLPPHIQSAIPPPSSQLISSSSLTPRLCYACHTTLTSRSSRGNVLLQSKESMQNRSHSPLAIPLPVWVSSRLEQHQVLGDGDTDVGREVWRSEKMGEGEMRETVKDFLLED